MNIFQVLSSQSWIPQLAATLLHFLWEGALVAVIFAISRNFTGHRSARFRYALACTALAVMAMSPVVTFEILGSPTVETGGLAPGGPSISAPSTGTLWGASAGTTPVGTWHGDLTTWIVLVWFAGLVVLSMRLFAGWLVASRMRLMLVRPVPAMWQRHLDGLSSRLRLSKSVRLLVSAMVRVPTVSGWLRPVVLIPVGMLTGFRPELVEALLAHELAHIRRHDYLINLLQGVAEAALFYHPAVWWISHHVREERERCCDDIAVGVCGDPLTYVRALTELESCRAEHLTPALAANGGSLSGRIARLLGVPGDDSRCFPAPVAAVVLAIAAVFGLAAQSAETPKFAVASIKQNKSGGTRAPSLISPGGKFTATNNTVRALILNAYGIATAPSLLSGGPGWIDSETYDIEAKAEDNAIPLSVTGKPLWDETRLMLRALLADRFKLSVHRETKEMPIYELAVAKGGPKLKPSIADCAKNPMCHGMSGNPRRMTFTGVDMYDVALILTGYSDRLVVDKTGVTGLYDMLLQWNVFAGRPDQPANDGAPTVPAASTSKEGNGPMPDSASLPGIFDALPQEAGLQLRATKGPVDAWVIDHVEQPTEN